MEFGVQFFPDVTPEEKAAERSTSATASRSPNWRSRSGYTHVRIVEHYFHYYGGYSPNPMVFLAAASQRTKTRAPGHRARSSRRSTTRSRSRPRSRCSTGSATGGSTSASRARSCRTSSGASASRPTSRSRATAKGIEQIDLLLREENVTHHGPFHTLDDVTSLPAPDAAAAAEVLRRRDRHAGDVRVRRPQRATRSWRFRWPRTKLRETLGVYRDAWRAAGHPGNGEVMLALPHVRRRGPARAREIARPNIEAYFHSLARGRARTGPRRVTSTDYPGYDKKYRAPAASRRWRSMIASGLAR